MCGSSLQKMIALLQFQLLGMKGCSSTSSLGPTPPPRASDCVSDCCIRRSISAGLALTGSGWSEVRYVSLAASRKAAAAARSAAAAPHTSERIRDTASIPTSTSCLEGGRVTVAGQRRGRSSDAALSFSAISLPPPLEKGKAEG